MAQSQRSAQSVPTVDSRYTRAVTGLLLCLLLVMATMARIHDIGRFSIWYDESIALFFSTARGSDVFKLPDGAIFYPAPAMGFEHAPQWWKIWTRIDPTWHPPLFHILLRIWVDALENDADITIRTLSVIFGLASIALLFDTMRRVEGPAIALTAAAIFTCSSAAIDFSQQARPYALLAFLSLLVFNLLRRVELDGPSRLQLTAVCAAVFLTALTHYFAIGVIAGAVLYASTHFQGQMRLKAVAAIASGYLLFAVTWLPMVFRNGHPIDAGYGNYASQSSFLGFIDAPLRLSFDDRSSLRWILAAALAVLVYTIPLLDRRKWFWWCWIAGAIGTPLAVDLIRHSSVICVTRYVFAACPAVCALLAMPMPMKVGRFVPVSILIGAIAFGIARFESGPAFSVGGTFMLEDHRASARFLGPKVRPGELLIVTGPTPTDPAIDYFVLMHYAGDLNLPLMLLHGPIPPSAAKKLAAYPRVWVLGQDEFTGSKIYLPGLPRIDVGASNQFESVWRVK